MVSASIMCIRSNREDGPLSISSFVLPLLSVIELTLMLVWDTGGVRAEV